MADKQQEADVGENSKIEWTHHTFNPWIGCQKVSPGCDHCYAESLSKRYGWTEWGPHGERKRTSAANWRKPLAWAKDMSDDPFDWTECWNCGGLGLVAGCFEDCCSGADCDPEDAESCCAPSRCDYCRGKGGWHENAEPASPSPLATGRDA